MINLPSDGESITTFPSCIVPATIFAITWLAPEKSRLCKTTTNVPERGMIVSKFIYFNPQFLCGLK